VLNPVRAWSFAIRKALLHLCRSTHRRHNPLP